MQTMQKCIKSVESDDEQQSLQKVVNSIAENCAICGYSK